MQFATYEVEYQTSIVSSHALHSNCDLDQQILKLIVFLTLQEKKSENKIIQIGLIFLSRFSYIFLQNINFQVTILGPSKKQ